MEIFNYIHNGAVFYIPNKEFKAIIKIYTSGSDPVELIKA